MKLVCVDIPFNIYEFTFISDKIVSSLYAHENNFFIKV